MTPELTGVRAKDSQAIVTLFAGADSGLTFAKQWGELEIPAAVGGVNVIAMSREFWKGTAGKANYYATGGSAVKAPFSPKTIPFWDKFVAKFNDYPNYTVASYNAMYILKEAIERAKSTETNAVIAELEKTDYQGLFGRVAFEKNHDMKWGKDYYQDPSVQWIDGELVPLIYPPEEGFRTIPGAVKYQLPPRVVKFWKK